MRNKRRREKLKIRGESNKSSRYATIDASFSRNEKKETVFPDVATDSIITGAPAFINGGHVIFTVLLAREYELRTKQIDAEYSLIYSKHANATSSR